MPKWLKKFNKYGNEGFDRLSSSQNSDFGYEFQSDHDKSLQLNKLEFISNGSPLHKKSNYDVSR